MPEYLLSIANNLRASAYRIIGKQLPHCWTGRNDFLNLDVWETYDDDGNHHDATCLEWDGHWGPHRWIDDRDIVVEFSEVRE